MADILLYNNITGQFENTPATQAGLIVDGVVVGSSVTGSSGAWQSGRGSIWFGTDRQTPAVLSREGNTAWFAMNSNSGYGNLILTGTGIFDYNFTFIHGGGNRNEFSFTRYRPDNPVNDDDQYPPMRWTVNNNKSLTMTGTYHKNYTDAMWLGVRCVTNTGSNFDWNSMTFSIKRYRSV